MWHIVRPKWKKQLPACQLETACVLQMEMSFAVCLWAGLCPVTVSQQPVPFWTENNFGDKQQTRLPWTVKNTATHWNDSICIRKHTQSLSSHASEEAASLHERISQTVFTK